MKTEFSFFCGEYSRVLRPAACSLDAAIECIQHESQEEVLRLPLAAVTDIRHRLRTLIDKIECQQAYLLIFGPLKSGKSTLMNAISGAYVSEVTSLPAYPCLVYVWHGQESSIALTRYNGRRTEITDEKVMQALVTDSHTNLADRLRQVEEQGGEFDPGVDYPEAIRRIDIQLPARSLCESGTVLVDTPGLYSRMRFGYDLMTREFRNNAACAVFVVKTDNLFLEQVFQEFNQLLGLFSRVFLVVNIDSSKKDLRPDGTLRPSMESQDPEKIVEAFRSFSMSAPLRKASSEGRLRIYPIDLLNAASRFLKDASGPGKKPNRTRRKHPVDREGAALEEARAKPKTRTLDFERFLADLTEYLNSSDYLQEFMRDSLQQGKQLGREVCQQCLAENLTAFREQQQRLLDAQVDLNQKLKAVLALEKVDWNPTLSDAEGDAQTVGQDIANELHGKALETMLGTLDQWFGSAAGLRELEQKGWNPELDRMRNTMAAEASRRVVDLFDRAFSEVKLTPDVAIHLDRIQLSPKKVYRRTRKHFEVRVAPKKCSLTIHEEQLPVNRSLWDRLLFRGQKSLRKRLFGAPEHLMNEVPPDKKTKKLTPGGKTALVKMVDAHLKAIFPTVPKSYVKDYRQGFLGEFQKNFEEALCDIRRDLTNRYDRLHGRIKANKAIEEALQSLRNSMTSLGSETDRVQERFLSVHGAGETVPKGDAAPAVAASSCAFSLWTSPLVLSSVPNLRTTMTSG